MTMNRPSVILLLFSVCLGSTASAAAPVPEVSRPRGSTTAQAIGALHTLRTIPEACVRLEGLFTGEASEPYRIEILPGDRCVRRASYVDARSLPAPPSQATHWILNDRIQVPQAGLPACVATVEIWRKPGTAAPPRLDAQGRARLYLDKPQQPVNVPVFTAVVLPAKGC